MSEPRYPYVHVDVSPEEVEEVSYLLWELGALGVEERDASTLNKQAGVTSEVTLVASFADDAAAQSAIDELVPRTGRLEHVVGDAWREAYKQYFKVTRLGPRLVIRPSWEPYTPSPQDVVVTVDPGRAFGTGTHESTRLLMAALDERVRGGERVLDVGCGTGILAICALKLGAKSALCIDVDPDAIEVTRENAALQRGCRRGPGLDHRRGRRPGQLSARARQHPGHGADPPGRAQSRHAWRPVVCCS